MAKKDKNILKDFTQEKIFDPKIAILGPKMNLDFGFLNPKLRWTFLSFT